MKEILVAGIGSCGINHSTSYLSLMNEEHDLKSSDPFPSTTIPSKSFPRNKKPKSNRSIYLHRSRSNPR